MIGLRDQFPYFTCPDCGCVQIGEPLANLQRYYPKDYYSLAPRAKTVPSRALEAARLLRDATYRTHPPLRLISRAIPNPVLEAIGKSFPKSSRILDVGCGYGRILMSLRRAGFTRLTGVDPYIDSSHQLRGSIKVVKGNLAEIPEDEWDLIIFNHSLEHIWEQNETFARVRELLAPNGAVLIRTPIAGTYAHRHYGPAWVQHDAPRHVVIHTHESLRRAASKAKLFVQSVTFDSTAFQFWGSELYARGLPLAPYLKLTIRRPGPLACFSLKQLASFKRAARRLNKAHDGDQAAFLLRRAPK